MLKNGQSLMDYFGRCPTDPEIRNLIYKQAAKIEQLENEKKELQEELNKWIAEFMI